MSDRDILEKAIKKAINGGWEYKGYGKYHYDSLKSYNSSWATINLKETTVVEDYETGGDKTVPITVSMNPTEMIFSHDFAKALWGEDTDIGYEHECETCLCDTVWYLPAWQYHLQQMVIADDPIKYLGDNI